MNIRTKGFTLIELLIAIAIIGVLTTLLMTNFVGIRQRARDAQRKSDIRQIQSALELYRSDQGSYPTISGTTYRLNSTSCPTSQSLQSGATVYLSKIPCDSLGTTAYNAGNYYYYTADGGVTYTLATCLENASDNDPNASDTLSTPAGTGSCTTKYFIVQNP